MFVFVSNSPGVECRGIWPYELTCDTNARKPQIICMTLRQIIVFLGKDFRMASFSCLGSIFFCRWWCLVEAASDPCCEQTRNNIRHLKTCFKLTCVFLLWYVILSWCQSNWSTTFYFMHMMRREFQKY